MRFSAPLLLLPVFLVVPMSATLRAQGKLAASRPRAESSRIPVSVRWNRLVPVFVEEEATRRRAARVAAAGDAAALKRIAQNPPPFLFRVYPILSVAQYAAVSAATDKHSASATSAAIASASAVVLTEFFIDSTVRASIARELARDVDHAGVVARSPNALLAGKRLGEEAARRVLAWVPPFNMIAPFTGTIPTGPGMWTSARGVPPIGTAMATSRAWLLDSASQFRPAPPPAYGSPAFDAAIEEVRRIARTRTSEQTQIAQKWDTGDPMGAWNETASAAILRHGMPEAEAVRVLALLNVGASDAAIACFDAKYHYWTIRPSQVDTTLVLADKVGLPNFPSYPSGHACTAGAFDAVLGHFFPKERVEFTRIAEEQAMSRLYGGIHYRFDNDGGLALGRIVAAHDVERERRGQFNAWRTAVVTKP